MGALCTFWDREQYELLQRIGAIEVPAFLDPVFMNSQSWESLSVRDVFDKAEAVTTIA